MDNNAASCFFSTVRPLLAGYRRHEDSDGDSSSGVLWAVYDRIEAESEVGWVADTGNTEFAERLTGLYRYSSGPGRGFADAPELEVSRSYVLVKQYRGLDI